MAIFRIIRQTLVFVSALIIISACTKEPDLIGLDLVDPGDLIKMGYSDTISVEAHSVMEDSIRTSNLTVALVGSMNDPVFGRTTATWFSQIRLATEPTAFGSYPHFDSAFLLLPYESAYGDTLSNMTLRVFEVTEDIIDSVHTHSNHSVAYDESHLLGELTFTPRPNDSSYFSGSKQAPTVRIPLNNRLGSRILLADTSFLASNDDFTGYFKGIAVVPETQNGIGSGSILKLKVSAGSSKIVMHYHNETDTSTYSFGINSECTSFNRYDHEEYTGASSMLQQQLAGDTLLGGDFIFLQAMGGIRMKLRFPFLDQWYAKEKVVVNDAQLIFTNSDPTSVFTPPSSLAIYPVADDGTLYPYQLVDADEGSTYFDGKYEEASKTYRFRISRYVQSIVNGSETNNGLFIIIPASSLNSERVVFSGYNSKNTGIRLYVKYTITK